MMFDYDSSKTRQSRNFLLALAFSTFSFALSILFFFYSLNLVRETRDELSSFAIDLTESTNSRFESVLDQIMALEDEINRIRDELPDTVPSGTDVPQLDELTAFIRETCARLRDNEACESLQTEYPSIFGRQ